MLRGEHLGGGHERALVPALHGDEQRAERHERLARADVALQQAVHGLRGAQVVRDLFDHAALAPTAEAAGAGIGGAALIRYLPVHDPGGAPPTRRVVLAWRRSFTRYEAIAALRNAIYDCALPGVTRLS